MPVALDDGSIQRPPLFDLRDCFDASPNRRSATLVDTPADEIIQSHEKVGRESHSYLLSRHAVSIPVWYVH